MKHTKEVMEQEKEEEIIEKYRQKLGLPPEEQLIQKQEQKSWMDIAKEIVLKPWIYVVACLTVISPYGAEIL